MKNMNKIVSLILTLIMVVCMAAPCYAINTDSTPNTTEHTITINTASQSETPDRYNAYQIFRGDITGGKLTNITWGTGVINTDDLIDALKEASVISRDITDALNAANSNNRTEAEAIAYVVADMDDNSEALDTFASVVAKHLSDTAYSNVDSNGNTANTITVEGDGYYLLKCVSAPGHGDAYTKYILKVAENVSIDLKKDAPSIDKFIVEKGETCPASAASIGDKITFQLVSTIPEMDGYDKYYYVIHDTLSEGLTFNNDVAISINGHQAVAYPGGQNYENFDYYVEHENGNIKIVFINFLQHKGKAGNVVVTYSATLNENAVITADGNPNTAYLQYSNDPNYDHNGDPDHPDDPDDPTLPKTPPTGTTLKTKVFVYTTALQLNKVSNADGTPSLTGAKFKIQGQSASVYKINGSIYQKIDSGTWYRLKDGTYTQTAPTEEFASLYESTEEKYAQVTVDNSILTKANLVNEGWVNADGVMTFTGLGAGTYTITELIAPDGYNLLKSPITVEIKWNGTGANAMWTVTASAKDVDDQDDTIPAEYANHVYSFTVENQEGASLPSTGGIGTTLFYITGALLAMAAFILLDAQKRKANFG